MEFVEFSELAHARRTNMSRDRSRDVDEATIGRLCELAVWAPNHKHTWPWRFAAFTGEARSALGQAFVQDLIALTPEMAPDDRKLTKTATKYTRSPAILVVASAPDDDPLVSIENRDAVAAGVQNILLGATALGLNSYWSTPPVAQGANVNVLCGFGPQDVVVAVIYLGWPEPGREALTPPPRPEPQIRYLS